MEYKVTLSFYAKTENDPIERLIETYQVLDDALVEVFGDGYLGSLGFFSEGVKDGPNEDEVR